MAGKKAILAGASGLVGGELLSILLAGDEYEKVIVLGRRSLNIEHPKLQEFIIEFDRMDDYQEFFHVDEVFCCLGTTIKKAGSKEAFKKVDVDYVLSLAKTAREMNVKKFLLVSSIGADSRSKIFYSRMKGLAEEGLKEIGFDYLHIFQPSLLLGERNEVRSGEHAAMIISKRISFIFRGSLKKYKPIEANVVAKVMYNCAQIKETGTHIHLSDEIADIAAKNK